MSAIELKQWARSRHRAVAARGLALRDRVRPGEAAGTAQRARRLRCPKANECPDTSGKGHDWRLSEVKATSTPTTGDFWGLRTAPKVIIRPAVGLTQGTSASPPVTGPGGAHEPQ